MASLHAVRRSNGPRLDSKRRLPISLSVDRVAWIPPHHRHGQALAFSQYSFLGNKRFDLSGSVVRHRTVAKADTGELAGGARCLGDLCALRNISLAARVGLLSVQCAPAA